GNGRFFLKAAPDTNVRHAIVQGPRIGAKELGFRADIWSVDEFSSCQAAAANSPLFTLSPWRLRFPSFGCHPSSPLLILALLAQRTESSKAASVHQAAVHPLCCMPLCRSDCGRVGL
ncbi:MAG: hypothetical protein IKE20_06510, partial [Eggerthellaceae bacterium]|nr:hypothetical protein [Eggerthellaceae bacterium]